MVGLEKTYWQERERLREHANLQAARHIASVPVARAEHLSPVRDVDLAPSVASL